LIVKYPTPFNMNSHFTRWFTYQRLNHHEYI
jgi:hypothetical protein